MLEGTASLGNVRVAGLAATEDVADEPLGTGELIPATTGGTSHPDLTRAVRGTIHEAPLLLRAWCLLTVLTVDPRADRAALSDLDAALSVRT